MGKMGLGKIVFSEETIQNRIEEVARQLNGDYRGEPVVLVGILKGSLYFLADLSRRLTMPMSLDFLAIGVRKDELTKTRSIHFYKDLNIDIAGKHVLLVEDVVGTGLTLSYVLQHLESCSPLSLKVCTLLDNPEERLLNLSIDYTCFTAPPGFVVGYGLDYKEMYRNLPYIAEYHR